MIAKISFYLDKRHLSKEGKAHIKLAVRKKGKCAFLLTNIFISPDQWDGSRVIGDRNAKFLNSLLTKKKNDAERAQLELSITGQIDFKDAFEIAELIHREMDPDYAETAKAKEIEAYLVEKGFVAIYKKCTASKCNKGTRSLYEGTLKKFNEFCSINGIDASKLRFEDVTTNFISQFEEHCLKSENQNTASIHLRNIRAVFNQAIDEGITNFYPFRKYKIKFVVSEDKSYSADQLRKLFDYKCYPGCEREAVDMFKIMICMIGINSIDLSNLSEIRNGRIDYIRKKTGIRYSIKVEPELQELIETYKGSEHLLYILERHSNYKTYFNDYNKALRKVGLIRVSGKKSEGSAILPDVCWGSARTSWATIAQEDLDIDRETIAAALGHHTVDVTDTYLRTKWRKKVDEANRRVIDWVFYGKK